jgi:alpha-D-ribose 1-methylphosphonate 5-triphosphate synthase subunit PhnG
VRATCCRGSREDRVELLAATDPELLVQLAGACIAECPPTDVIGPEVGVVVLQVREPVVGDRFNLAEVLVTEAQVVHRDVAGWAMRPGEDREATLAAAILDAEATAGGPMADAVTDLCEGTRHRLAVAEAAEWAELEPTVVRFEELDT